MWLRLQTAQPSPSRAVITLVILGSTHFLLFSPPLPDVAAVAVAVAAAAAAGAAAAAVAAAVAAVAAAAKVAALAHKTYLQPHLRALQACPVAR